MSKATAYFSVERLDGEHDVKQIKRELDSLRGVISVGVNKEENTISVDFDTTGPSHKGLQDKLIELGYNITDTRFENHIM